METESVHQQVAKRRFTRIGEKAGDDDNRERCPRSWAMERARSIVFQYTLLKQFQNAED
jgi:hypothetical protein